MCVYAHISLFIWKCKNHTRQNKLTLIIKMFLFVWVVRWNYSPIPLFSTLPKKLERGKDVSNQGFVGKFACETLVTEGTLQQKEDSK